MIWIVFGVIWVWHLVFVLPTIAVSAVCARCPFTPTPVRNCFQRYVSWLTEPDLEQEESW